MKIEFSDFINKKQSENRFVFHALEQTKTTQCEFTFSVIMTLQFGYPTHIQGRGSKSRMLIHHIGIECEMVNPVLGDITARPFHGLLKWQTEVKPEMKKNFPLVNLPYLIDGDTKIGGEFPILHFLSEKYGYYGENEMEKGLVLAVSDFLKDMSTVAMGFSVYAQPGVTPLTEKVKNVLLPMYLKTLESQVKSCGKKYSVSDKITLADILFILLIHKVCLFWKSALNEFPEVKRVYDELLKDEKIKESLDKEFELPVTCQYGLRFKELSEDELKEFKEKKLWETSTFVTNQFDG